MCGACSHERCPCGNATLGRAAAQVYRCRRDRSRRGACRSRTSDVAAAEEAAAVQVLKWHKAQQTRRSRETQARLNALKLQDYSSYLELAAQAKDSRLREVIHATEAVMDDLILKV